MVKDGKLTDSQTQAISALLKSFGMKRRRIAEVERALTGRTGSINVAVILTVIAFGFLALQTYFPIRLGSEWLGIIDSYLRIILTNWPAAVLILGIILLFKYEAAISFFITNRLTEIAGVLKASPGNQSEGEAGLQSAKKEYDEVIGPEKPTSANIDVEIQIKKTQLFERIYSVIYGSQLSLLTRLNSSGAISTADAAQYYLAATEQYPTLRNYTYPNYINFLVSQGLINLTGEIGNGTLSIGVLGKEFLEYLATSGLTLNKAF